MIYQNEDGTFSTHSIDKVDEGRGGGRWRWRRRRFWENSTRRRRRSYLLGKIRKENLTNFHLLSYAREFFVLRRAIDLKSKSVVIFLLGSKNGGVKVERGRIFDLALLITIIRRNPMRSKRNCFTNFTFKSPPPLLRIPMIFRRSLLRFIGDGN